MRIRTRTAAVIAAVAAGLVAGTAPVPAAPLSSDAHTRPACPPPPAADVTTPKGWLGYLAGRRQDSAFYVDDGRAGVAVRAPHRKQPTASAIKVLHLGAYARAVVLGQVEPWQRVTLRRWERWWFPGTDGGAHLAALDRLGIPADESGALNPSRTVTIDTMVGAMMRESDNAVPDFLRHLLGNRALRAAAEAAGWEIGRLPTFLGQTISLFLPRVDRWERWPAAFRYATDREFRTHVQSQPVDEDRIRPWVRTTFSASPRQLAGIHAAFASGDFGPGTRVALRHLEWGDTPPGLVGLGFKSGSLPGVITDGFEVRREDGSYGVAVLLNRDMTAADMEAALAAQLPEQALLVAALLDKSTLRLLRCIA